MAVTITDVATAAGVSASTVSRALSAPEKVNAATREYVRKVARDLGYVPSRAARSLTMGRTGTIGLIVPDIANPFFPPIIKAVQARAARRDVAVLLADSDERPRDEVERTRVMARQVDGVVLVSPRMDEATLVEIVQQTPTVVVNRRVPGAPCVVIENADGITQAVEHLAALEHRRICYLNGPRNSWSNAQRRSAIEEACAKHDVELVEFGPFEPQIQAGVRAADLVVQSNATAVLAYDDMIAIGVMTRLLQRGLMIGVDISVIGIDDSPMSAVTFPNLTSIHVPGAEAGEAAVDLLLDLLDGDWPPSDDPAVIELETHLVVRGSSGSPRPVTAEQAASS